MNAIQYLEERERYLDVEAEENDYWADYRFHLKEIKHPEDAVAQIKHWADTHPKTE